MRFVVSKRTAVTHLMKSSDKMLHRLKSRNVAGKYSSAITVRHRVLVFRTQMAYDGKRSHCTPTLKHAVTDTGLMSLRFTLAGMTRNLCTDVRAAHLSSSKPRRWYLFTLPVTYVHQWAVTHLAK
jgi:hypothetical protein